MEGIMNIFAICFRVGLVIVCVILVVYGILRWLAHKRDKRLPIASWIAFVVLCVFALASKGDSCKQLINGQGNAEITTLFINTAKITVKLLMLGAVVGSAIMLLFFIFYFMYSIFGAIYKHEKTGASLLNQFCQKSRDIKEIIKTPIGMFIITWGILALFVVLPLLMGKHNSPSMAETWRSGVINIADFSSAHVGKYVEPVEAKFERVLDDDEYEYKNIVMKTHATHKQPFYNALAGYILIFIVVLGVSFAAIKILYSIIDNTLKSKNGKTLLGEYSSSIGVLAVGVALLWTMQERDFTNDDIMIMARDCIISFAMVTFIVATAILTLEVIRLLMDMREKLIRREARYLFISLVGQASLLLLGTLNSIYGAISNAIGTSANSNEEEIYNKMQRKMLEIMDKQIEEQMEEETEEPKEKNLKENLEVFPRFIEKITKK